MIKDRMVRVKLKKAYKEQRPMSYVGKVVAFNDVWLVMDGRGIMLSRAQPSGVQIDERPSRVMVPRDNVETIIILPDTYDIKAVQVTTEGQQLRLVVPGALDVFLGEMGEG